MTKLLDSGYLETDDPVVAVCFLEREAPRDTLYSVSDNHCEIIAPEGGEDGDLTVQNQAYPILVPASTVAEVVDARRYLGGHIKEWGIIEMYVGRDSLTEWLRKHTQATDV